MKDDALKKRQRVAGICAMLAQGQGVRVSELAARFGVCEKSIRRDLDDMLAAGVQIANDRGRWVLIGPPPRVTSGLDLTVTEAVALFFAIDCFQGMPNPPMATEVEKAIEKLKAHLPAGAAGAAAASRDRYSIALPLATGCEGNQETMDTIEWALENSLVLRIRYVTEAAAEETALDLEPYALHFTGGHWYLIGRNRQQDEMTMLRVDRMTECSELPDSFERRPGFRVRDFLDHAWRSVCGGLTAW